MINAVNIKGYNDRYVLFENGNVFDNKNECFLTPQHRKGHDGEQYKLYKRDRKGSLVGGLRSKKKLLSHYFKKELDEFKYIKGYEGLYGVSKQGRVYSYTTHRVISQRPSKTSPYLYVRLYKNNVGKHYSVHRLVASTYIENPNNLPEVDHKDRDIHNNNVENLRWVSRKENLLNTKMGLVRNFRRCELTHKGKIVGSFESIMEASRYANKVYGASLSGINRNLKSGECTIRV